MHPPLMPNRTTGVKSEEVISMASDDKNVSDSVDANSHSISSLSSSTASLIAAGAAGCICMKLIILDIYSVLE
jgi:hypothetical protein